MATGNSRKVGFISLLCATGMCFGGAAVAQERSFELEEIVITARKR